jgi:hypothetical protein
MLASSPIIQRRPQTLSASAASRSVGQGKSRWTIGSSTSETKMNAPMIGATSRA